MKKNWLLILLLVMALALVACGGGEEPVEELPVAEPGERMACRRAVRRESKYLQKTASGYAVAGTVLMASRPDAG